MGGNFQKSSRAAQRHPHSDRGASAPAQRHPPRSPRNALLRDSRAENELFQHAIAATPSVSVKRRVRDALILWVALEIRADIIELKLSHQATQLCLKSDHHRLDTLEHILRDHETRFRTLEQSR